MTLNEKKTQICRINKGFVFLKQFIFLTDTGKIVRRPHKGNIVRERRKLKSFKKKLDDKEIELISIINQYKSWRGSIRKYAKAYTIKNMDNLFGELFFKGDKKTWKRILKEKN